MIYCNIKGGLGNILFQIAACKAMALRKGTESSFPNFSEHLNYLKNNSRYNRNIPHVDEYRTFLKVSEKKPENDLKIYNFPFEFLDYFPNEDSFFMDGYFQSEKYFQDYKSEILDLIRPDEKTLNYIFTKYKHIIEKNSVSLHVRRGDYVDQQDAHPLQTISYYETALNKIKSFDNIVIFSDDLEWCKQNLNFKEAIFIQDKDYIELFLMSYCKNNIICNSSFSWWGAWLNLNINKIVIAPSRWFGDTYKSINTKNLIPEEWHII